jgi:protein O-mannosyl-transferase
MKIKDTYKILFIAFVIFTVYYPSLYAPLNPVDDVMLTNRLLNMGKFSLWDIFASASGDYYYRPLLTLSFVSDKYLWGIQQSFMHLENILLHVINAVLVFLVARKFFSRLEIDNSLLPLASTMLFALHPINTEAVNWISGRSDLLSGVFVLLATFYLLNALEKSSFISCLLSYFLFITGCLAKETVLFFLPAALLIILCYDGRVANSLPSLICRIRARLLYLGVYISGFCVYFIVRLFAIKTGDPGIRITKEFIMSNSDNIFTIINKVLTGGGFYLKKLFYPWPLNFSINRVSDLYLFIGIILLFLLVYLFHKRDLLSSFFLASVMIGSSAILLLLVRPAWTPFAERYMYIPSTFFSIAAVASLHQLFSRLKNKNQLLYAITAFFLILAFATFQRNLIWQDNVKLFEDTVKKSPDFPFAKATLANVLMDAGRYEEAKNIIKTNMVGKNVRNWEFLELQKAQVMFSEGDLESARLHILDKVRSSAQLYGESRKMLLKINQLRLENALPEKKEEVELEIVDLLKTLFSIYKDPFYYYRLGQVYLLSHKKTDAAKYFGLAFKNAPEGAYYKTPAKILYEKLIK